MASRFLYQRLSSRMYESTRLLGVRASASSLRDVAPLIPHVSEGGIGALFHGATHPGTANLGIHGHGASIGALGYLLHGPSERPCMAVTIIHRIHCNAPRCYNTLSTTTTSRPTTDTPSLTTVKTAFADSMEQTLTSSCPARDADDDWETERDACLAELEAKKATLSEAEYEEEKTSIIEEFAAARADIEALRNALEANRKIWKAKMDKDNAEFRFLFRSLLFIFAVFATFGISKIINEFKRKGKGESSKVAAPRENPEVSES